jgi:hypothetical protein
MTTCNRVDLETLGGQRISPKISSDTDLKDFSRCQLRNGAKLTQYLQYLHQSDLISRIDLVTDLYTAQRP